MNYSECITRPGRIALAGLVLILGSALLPSQAQAQVPPVVCADVIRIGPTTADSDNDGFTDFQECTAVVTLGHTPETVRTFPWCGTPTANGVLPTRDLCMDPNSRDLFAILDPDPAGSLLPAVQSPGSTTPYNPFLPFTAHGINFTGLNALGLAVHTLNVNEAALNRTVSAAVLGLPAPRAIKVAESVDLNGVILGNCQYGTPSGLDGCVIYTRRTQNFIASACAGAAIQTASGAPSDAQQVLWAYTTYLALHEAGHSLGGLTGEYNSRFGGYHYKPGAGLVMDQAVTYTLKGTVCKFFISPNWNLTLDPQAVRLK
jgi:hypothetical protein